MEISAEDVHTYDQAYAASVDMFLTLVGNYVDRRGQDRINELPEQVTILALAEFLAHSWDTDHLVSALSVAVVIIAEAAAMP